MGGASEKGSADMPATRTHSRCVRGRLVFYEHGNRQRWIKAYGPDVYHWELLTPEAEKSSALLRYAIVADSSGHVQNYHGAAPYIVENDTHAAANKSGAMQLRTAAFKLEASKELYFGIEYKLANASSVGLFAGLFEANSGDFLKSSGVQQSKGGAFFISATGAKTLTPTTATASAAASSTTSTTTIGTTAQTLEIHWDGSTTLTYYASGVQLGQVTSNLCQNKALAPGWTVQGNNKQMHVKWARCIQLR